MDVEEPNHLTLEARIQALMDHGIKKPLTIFNSVKKFHKVSERTVYNKFNQIQSGQSLKRKEYFRENTKEDDEMKDQIIEYFRVNEYVASVRQLKDDLDLEISETIIKQILEEVGISYQKINVLPMLTDQQEQNRVEFSQKYLNFNWNNTVFVDEVSFWTHQVQTHVWCFNQENISIKVPKYPSKIHAFAGISKYGLTNLYFFEENLNGELYAKIITNFLIPECQNLFKNKKWVIAQDNDPKHKNKIVQETLKANKIKTIEDWPSGSPDLNPIENIWGYVKKLLKQKLINNIEELQSEIEEIWENIPEEVVDSCIESMQNRLIECIESKGQTINY